MRLLHQVLALALTLPTTWSARCADDAAVTVLHDFGFPSWAENLAVRANGQILVTRLDQPSVYQVDPDTGDAVLVHAWDAGTYKGCLGLAETADDVFYVVTSAFVDEQFEKTGGVNAIQRIDMAPFATIGAAAVSHLVDIPEAVFLNGLTSLGNATLLAADVQQGRVYKISTTTAAYSVALDDELMKFHHVADPPTHLGSNGLKVFDGHLYWANTAAGFLARVPIDDDAVPRGSSAVVATNLPRADDFVIRTDGVAFVCQNQMDTLSVAYLDGIDNPVVAHPIAGSNTSTLLAGVTAARFGRRASDATRLYLSTSGALALPINGSVTVDGTLSYIDASVY